ncbi:hypothetical protein GUJ93_ZPchr0006g42448 [Zizania palustris]|uniref:t-SNARE coiled-coil homology domain-containing protein n=1 Tax=Zizania palustris TaxID=103762 RepID=A0A8J5VNJ1_ZIZPA|nr:hypothetical protein GUJ93_ZPchr0006g42448 [Zizania palustris]
MKDCYRLLEGLTARPAASSSSSEISLQIDPITADLDDHILGLRGQVRKLRGVAQEIQTEAKYQNDFISQLQMTLTKAQAGVKNNMRRINKKIIQNGSNHLFHATTSADQDGHSHRAFSDSDHLVSPATAGACVPSQSRATVWAHVHVPY